MSEATGMMIVKVCLIYNAVAWTIFLVINVIRFIRLIRKDKKNDTVL